MFLKHGKEEEEEASLSLHGVFMNMGDSLGLIGKRLLLLLNDGGGSAAGSAAAASAAAPAANESAVQAAWLRGTVRAVSVIGLASPGVEVHISKKLENNRMKMTK